MQRGAFLFWWKMEWGVCGRSFTETQCHAFPITISVAVSGALRPGLCWSGGSGDGTGLLPVRTLLTWKSAKELLYLTRVL